MKLVYTYCSILLSLLAGCIGAGTHGSIKAYRYPVPKDTLQRAIMDIITHDPNIYRDTSLDYLGSSPLLDSNGSGNYSANDNYYNDIKHYVTIRIMSGLDTNQYTFRYYGPDEEWKTENSSEIFICYAYDKNRNGGSEGNGGVTRHNGKLREELTSVFEKGLVSKIDSVLKVNHTEED